jgi:carnitine O-acetyltransferase
MTGTFTHEDRLPRVPLPTVEESCRRFLEWCAPLLTADELAATEGAVAAFVQPDGPGRKLHAAVEQDDDSAGGHSWIEPFWAERYLDRRESVAINTNFFFLFKDSGQRRVERAAGLIAAAINYKLRLDAELVAPVLERGQPLSMEQSKFLFSTTRIPGSLRDTIRAPYTADWPGPSPARHIVVFYRGNIFRMDVLSAAGPPHSVDDLAAGLRAVMTAGAARAEPDRSVGHLTTQARSAWAASREALLACDPANADALDAVETALFCLCLDDVAPKDMLAACDHLLHGDSGNRWFDKAVSLIVFADGRAGLHGEHSRLDGATIRDFVDVTLGTPAEEHVRQSGARSQGLPAVAAVEFVLDDDLRNAVISAANGFAACRAEVASALVSFEDFGADLIKRLGMSPDAFVQMAFQLAHKRAKGVVGTTYESIAMRHYRHGRTGAMRVVTPEVLRFLAAMEDPEGDPADRGAAFRAAADKHRRRAQECKAGHGPEHHLTQMKRIQLWRGEQLGVTEPPALYESPGWLTMRDDYLSTSAVPVVEALCMGFGPTGAQCIGVPYRLLPDRLDIYLSTPLPVAKDMLSFAEKLPEALRELRDLLRPQQ